MHFLMHLETHNRNLLMQELPEGCLSNITIIASCQVINRHLPQHSGEKLRLRDGCGLEKEEAAHCSHSHSRHSVRPAA